MRINTTFYRFTSLILLKRISPSQSYQVVCLHTECPQFQLSRSKSALWVTPTRTPSPLFDECLTARALAVVHFLSDAYDTAKMLCEKYYLAAPKLKIEEFNSKISFISPSVSSGERLCPDQACLEFARFPWVNVGPRLQCSLSKYLNMSSFLSFRL